MKKFYFLAVAAVALASCTNEESIFEPKAPQEIAFQAVATNATRGAVTSTDSWEAPIYVSAAYSASGAGGTHSNLFNNHELVKFEKSGDSWNTPKGTESYYYPSDGKIDFLAYASGTPAKGETAGDEVTPTATVARDPVSGEFTQLKLDYKNTGLAGKTDVMYALTPKFECPPTSTTGVSLKFQHSLAWLSVSVSDNTKQVYIKSIKVNDVYLKGELSIPITNHALGNPTWDVEGVDASSEVEFRAYCPPSPALVENLATATKEGVLVVPSKQTQLTLVYQLEQNQNVDITHIIKLNNPNDDLTWDAGKRYIYKISFNDIKVISFTCDVEKYDESEIPVDHINQSK